jgi:hypothetical protein
VYLVKIKNYVSVHILLEQIITKMSESNIQNTQGWWNPTMGELAKQHQKEYLVK